MTVIDGVLHGTCIQQTNAKCVSIVMLDCNETMGHYITADNVVRDEMK